MSSLTYKLEKLKAKAESGRTVGRMPVVRINGIPYTFENVAWGGTSPRVYLRNPEGHGMWASAADWKRLGAKF